MLPKPRSVVFTEEKTDKAIKNSKPMEEKYIGLYSYLLDSKMADDIDNLFLDEPQNKNEGRDEELIKELRTLINGCDNVNDLVKIIEKYSKSNIT